MIKAVTVVKDGCEVAGSTEWLRKQRWSQLVKLLVVTLFCGAFFNVKFFRDFICAGCFVI